jgi:hypothetical protein
MYLLLQCLLHSSNDVRVATSATVKQVAKTSRFSIEDLQQLVPPLIESTSEKNSPVRLSAEQALVSILELRKNSDRLQVVSCSIPSILPAYGGMLGL